MQGLLDTKKEYINIILDKFTVPICTYIYDIYKVYNEDEKNVAVMNMIPEHHLDSLHKNPDKKTKFIKRAED